MKTCLPLLRSMAEKRFGFGMALNWLSKTGLAMRLSSRVRVVEHVKRDVFHVHFDVID